MIVNILGNFDFSWRRNRRHGKLSQIIIIVAQRVETVANLFLEEERETRLVFDANLKQQIETIEVVVVELGKRLVRILAVAEDHIDSAAVFAREAV